MEKILSRRGRLRTQGWIRRGGVRSAAGKIGIKPGHTLLLKEHYDARRPAVCPRGHRRRHHARPVGYVPLLTLSPRLLTLHTRL